MMFPSCIKPPNILDGHDLVPFGSTPWLRSNSSHGGSHNALLLAQPRDYSNAHVSLHLEKN